jgi:hypothetical protein
MYGVMNQYLPNSLFQYPTRDSIQKIYSDAPVDTKSPGVSKLYVYSNMADENPGADLSILLTVYKEPVPSYSYPEYTNFVAVYKKSGWEYGYAQKRSSYEIGLSFKKVK